MKEIIQAVNDGDNILITGGAGVGKTYHTNSLINHLTQIKRRFAVCAMTGLASQHLHFGMTIHRFLGIGNKTSTESFGSLMHDDIFRNNLSSIIDVETIFIDESSMMRSDSFELIDMVLKEARGIKEARDGVVFSRRNTEPFGGYQVIIIADFCQLPPVVKKDESVPCKWIFQHQLFLDAKIRVYNLLEVKRTTDLKLATLCNKIRVGYLDKESEELIASRANAASSLDATVLMSRINNVKDYNDRRINSEAGDTVILSGGVKIRDEIKDSEDSNKIKMLYRTAISESGLEKDIKVKIGCKIMLLANNPMMDYSNGSQGILLGFKQFDDISCTFTNRNSDEICLDFSYFGECLHILLDNGRDVVVPKKQFKVYGASFDKNGKREIDAIFFQYPVILGYSISIHKSQGMSLSNMVLDCQQIFAEGQFYVGISRARSFEGMSLLNFNKHYLKADTAAVNFYLQIASFKNGEIYGI